MYKENLLTILKILDENPKKPIISPLFFGRKVKKKKNIEKHTSFSEKNSVKCSFAHVEWSFNGQVENVSEKKPNDVGLKSEKGVRKSACFARNFLIFSN